MAKSALLTKFKCLPSDQSDKWNSLKQLFPSSDDRLITSLSNNHRIEYLVDDPTFVISYIDDEIVYTKFIMCETHLDEHFYSNFDYSRLFAIYNIYDTRVRGAYIEDYDGKFIEWRNSRIDEILS